MINKKYKPQLIARESAVKILYQMKIKDDSLEDVMFSFVEKRPYDEELLSLILNKYHPYEDLPKLINPGSGYIFNTNNSPFNSTDKKDNLKEINYNSSFGFKEKENNRSLRFMELISSFEKVSYSDFKEIKYSIVANILCRW